MELLSFVLCAIIAIISLAVYNFKQRYEYWKKRGIPHVEPQFPYGIFTGIGRVAGITEIFKIVYDKFKGTGPFAGFHMLLEPSVVVLDLDLAKNILIKDFNNFSNRGVYYNERDDPLRAHLAFLEVSKWRPLRGKLTSTFTSGKMKYMFPTVVKVGEELVKTFEREIKINSDIEMKDIMARYTTDVIGSCAFGIECNCLKDPDVEFRKMGNKAFEVGRSKYYLFVTQMYPQLARFLHIKYTPDDVTEFFLKTVNETVEYRERNHIRRNDFMDLLINLKNQKNIHSESGEEYPALTMSEMVAQSFIFFAAGFETSSTTLGFALYELARNQNIQDKLRREINDVLARHSHELNYESIKEIKYLDQVLNESLRMYPPVTQLRRIAEADYPTSNPRYIIPKNAHVMIPILGIQRDPDIYPNPEVFDPDRFTSEEIQKRHPMAWLPFGVGPRNCIGLRFAKMQSRIGLALLIRNFKFSITKDTPISMKFSKVKDILATENGIILKVEKV